MKKKEKFFLITFYPLVWQSIENKSNFDAIDRKNMLTLHLVAFLKE